MSCIKKAKLRCADGRLFAICVKYEGDIPAWSELTGENCVVVEETIEDLYNQVTENTEALDVSTLTSSCLTYTELTLPTVLQAHADAICSLQGVAEGADYDITGWGLDMDCLVDACGGQAAPMTLPQLIQVLINQVCANTAQIATNTAQIATNTAAIQTLQNLTSQQGVRINDIEQVDDTQAINIDDLQGQVLNIQNNCC